MVRAGELDRQVEARTPDSRGTPGAARTRGTRSCRAAARCAGRSARGSGCRSRTRSVAVMPSVANGVRTHAWNPAACVRHSRSSGERADLREQLRRHRRRRRASRARDSRGARSPGRRTPGSASHRRDQASPRARGTRCARRARAGSIARNAWPMRVGRPSSVKKLSDSKPNAEPESAHTSSSTVSAQHRALHAARGQHAAFERRLRIGRGLAILRRAPSPSGWACRRAPRP